MIKDAKLLLGEEQGAITADAATTNVIDFGEAMNGDMSPRGKMFVAVSTAGAGTGSCTFKIQDSADNSTFADIAASKDYDVADLVEGSIVEVSLPGVHRRYVRGYFDITGTVTAGAYTSHLVVN